MEGQLAEQLKVLYPKAWSGRVPDGAVWGTELVLGLTLLGPTEWCDFHHVALTSSETCLPGYDKSQLLPNR